MRQRRRHPRAIRRRPRLTRQLSRAVPVTGANRATGPHPSGCWIRRMHVSCLHGLWCWFRPHHSLPRECIVNRRMVYPPSRVQQCTHRRKVNLLYCALETSFLFLSHHSHPLSFAVVVWVVTAAIVIKVSNTPSVFLSDERVIRPLLHVALVLMGINTLLVLYLAIYLPKIKGIQDSSGWDVYCPRVVPSMAIFGVVAAILLIRCTWPVWGFLSPLILGTEALGALFSLHFLPWLP